MLIARFTDCKASSRHFKTPLTSTTAVRMQAEGAATTEARPEARISGPDMTGIAIRQLMPLVHGTRAASLHRHSPWHSLLDKGQQDDRPRAILLTGSSQRTRPYFGRSETASLRRHRAKLQQIADCRLQISDDGSRFQVWGPRFQISDFRWGRKGGGPTLHMREKVVEACRRPVQRSSRDECARQISCPRN